ncbi:hypothetical protein CCACVL1_24293 [Corchorus capsularis]|uniref:Uncharacterized protein n=1 Tax=Corchorus capsularis TaxID=210143 RepID=A0A1R3GQB5_COCAP|nr:hypothetical protein CCACVL1_24293 [Corchorus capsularis]
MGKVRSQEAASLRPRSPNVN